MLHYFELTTISTRADGGHTIVTEAIKTVEQGIFLLGRIAACRTADTGRFHQASGFPHSWRDDIVMTVYPVCGDSVMDAVASLRRVDGPFPG